MPRRAIRSVSTPIVLTVVAVSLGIALLVGWTLMIGHTFMRGPEIAGGVWLLVSGIASFLFVVTVLVMFGISLVREILEARRQVRFIDSVTHELKSPLASLRLCLQTLGRSDLSPDQREELERVMCSDVDRLAAFIDDVLNASRVTSGRMTVSIVEVSVRDLLRESAETVELRHGLEPGSIGVEVDEGLVLSTDRGALQVAVSNLIDNAVKYSDPPIDVRVRAERRDRGGVEVEVSDIGIGIDARDLKRVFQRFYRVPDETVRARSGTGLGLYVVSAMLRSLGGRVTAHSPGRGRGTTMKILLPASLEVKSSMSQSRASRSQTDGHGGNEFENEPVEPGFERTQ